MIEKDNANLTDDNSNPHDWMQEVASRSFEPELLISGAAIYLTSNVPSLIEWSFDYYTQNLLSDVDALDAALPLLIYGFLKSNAYILIFTFLIHFIMRAFWVGMIGLISVYPDDIQYDKIKNFDAYFKSFFKEKLGKTEDFIIRLDKRCSVIFSSASM